jgi:hypothetical protein
VKIAGQHGRKELSLSIQELNKQVARVEEKCILYRTAGWTVFEMDLDIGRREREKRRSAGTLAKDKHALGLGIRMETYYKGRFYEPFYLIFARPSQMVDHITKAGTSDANRNITRLCRHTVPHFVPLGELTQSYLRPVYMAERDTGAGGLGLLDSLMQQDGLDLFLSQLHAHLQSFVSRRQQAMALSQLELPGSTASSLRAFSNDSFGQLSIRWDLPVATEKDLKAFEESEGMFYPNNDGSETDRAIKEEKSEGQTNVALEVSIVYHDFSSDTIGRPAKEVSKRRQMVQALGSTETPGLKCTFATILVETIQSKVPKARRATSNDQRETLQIRRKRKTDWEMFFTSTEDAKPELHEAFRVITDLAWKEEMQRAIMDTM